MKKPDVAFVLVASTGGKGCGVYYGPYVPLLWQGTDAMRVAHA